MTRRAAGRKVAHCVVTDILKEERERAVHRIARLVHERGFVSEVEKEVYAEAVRSYDDMTSEHMVLGEAR